MNHLMLSWSYVLGGAFVAVLCMIGIMATVEVVTDVPDPVYLLMGGIAACAGSLAGAFLYERRYL